MRTIDLNADLGEGYGAYRAGDDEAMLAIVTSANVACGFHAGDPEIMAATFRIAKARGVAVGAHPGFPDLWGFGRRRIPFSAGELERLIAYQLGAAAAMAAYSGHRITYFKPHGALANIAAAERDVADAIARAARAVDRSLVFLAIAATNQIPAGEAQGLAVVGEIFADRGYTEDGQLIPRGKPGALLKDAGEAAARVIAMIERGGIITASGRTLPASFGSICIHGDSAEAVGMATEMRAKLEAAGLGLAPFAP